MTSVTISDYVTSIGQEAFYYCSGLAFVWIGISVTDIGKWAFQACSALHDIYVHPSNANYSDLDGVLFNRNQRFVFTATWARGQTIVVEACSNLVNPVWVPLQTNILPSGSYCFSDLAWLSYPSRMYRVRSVFVATPE